MCGGGGKMVWHWCVFKHGATVVSSVFDCVISAHIKCPANSLQHKNIWRIDILWKGIKTCTVYKRCSSLTGQCFNRNLTLHIYSRQPFLSITLLWLVIFLLFNWSILHTLSAVHSLKAKQNAAILWYVYLRCNFLTSEKNTLSMNEKRIKILDAMHNLRPA